MVKHSKFNIETIVKQVKELYEAQGFVPSKRQAIALKIVSTRYIVDKYKWSEILALAGLKARANQFLDTSKPKEEIPEPPEKSDFDPTKLNEHKRKFKPKILMLDIETAPIEARVWGIWDVNVGTNQITRDWFVLSFCAKFYEEDTVYYLDQRYSNPIEDDGMLMVAIHHLMSEADIVVGHNLDKFDMKKLNTRFLKHGLGSVGFVKQVDTLKIVKRFFGITSNKLDYVAKFLGLEGKLSSRKFQGQELWNACLANNQEAWDEMESYNKQDVLVLEKVFKELLHWDRSINLTPYLEENTCTCGSTEFIRHSYRVTNASKFMVYKCASCKKEYQGKENVMDKDTRKYLLKL